MDDEETPTTFKLTYKELQYALEFHADMTERPWGREQLKSISDDMREFIEGELIAGKVVEVQPLVDRWADTIHLDVPPDWQHGWVSIEQYQNLLDNAALFTMRDLILRIVFDLKRDQPNAAYIVARNDQEVIVPYELLTSEEHDEIERAYRRYSRECRDHAVEIERYRKAKHQ